MVDQYGFNRGRALMIWGSDISGATTTESRSYGPTPAGYSGLGRQSTRLVFRFFAGAGIACCWLSNKMKVV